MFGFLKKKLKEGIEKISNSIAKKEEEKIEEAVEEIKKEEHIEEPKQELVKEVEEEIEKSEAIEGVKTEIPEIKPIEEKPEIVEEKPSEKAVELFEKEVEEKIVAPEREILIEKKLEEPEIIETKEEVEESKEIPEKIEEPKRGFLERLLKRKPKEAPKVEKGILEKIKKKIIEKKIEEDDVKGLLKDFEMNLISSDVAVEVADKICNDLRNNLVGKFIKRGDIENIIKESFRNSILDILKVESFDLLEKVKSKKPFLIVFLGFNGSGKTTSIARVGYLLKKQGLSCVFAAADSWRAAAIEQLEEHGKKLGIEVIKHKYGADPAAVIFDAVKHAQSKDVDVILADTAGRSHANLNLMDELKKIIKVNNPDLKILILDALTGNDIYDQCKLFNNAVGVDALIITKADVYEKGGATLSASFTIKKPILYLGVGQKYEDLEKFDSNKIVEKLLE
jgi:fused signal recognition particle receptor